MVKDTGRCINCGFLGKKDVDDYGQECYIASSRNREEGNFSHHIILSRLQLDTIAWCYANKADFVAEIRQMDESKPQQERILKAITDNRQCSSWYPWKEFMWPKEHFEESVMLTMEKRREEFEQRMEKERKEFDLKLFEISQKVQADSAKVAEKAESFSRRMTLFFIVLAILGLLGALLPLAYPNGIPWLMNFFGSRPN